MYEIELAVMMAESFASLLFWVYRKQAANKHLLQSIRKINVVDFYLKIF